MAEATLQGKLSVAISANDVQRSLDFYVKGLGFTEADRMEKNGSLEGAMITAGDVHLGVARRGHLTPMMKSARESERSTMATSSNTRSNRKLKALATLIGVWNTEGDIAATATSPSTKLLATDTYEWLPGGHFLMHRVDARIGDAASRSMEIYCYDDKRNSYVSRSYDDQGKIEEFTADLKGRKWSIKGEALRFAGQFSVDGTMLSGRWEQRSGTGEWATLMDIRLARAA